MVLDDTEQEMLLQVLSQSRGGVTTRRGGHSGRSVHHFAAFLHGMLERMKAEALNATPS